MQKLDLSLDIPGAPFVRYATAESNPNPQTEPAWRRAVPEQPPVVHSGDLLPAECFAPSLPVTWPPLNPAVLEDLKVRRRIQDAWQQVTWSDVSMVPPAALVSGDLVCKNIRILGELNGSLSVSGLVYVEEGAVVHGPIHGAGMVIIAGTVATSVNQAAIRCTGLTVLTHTARVVGHVQCQSVAIYDGACVVGTVQSHPG